MKISETWLRSWVNPDLSVDELIHKLTMAGLEVDGIEKAAPEFSGVVVGKIVEIAAHPDAEKLRVCQVTNGESIAQVVCGAKNAREGLVIPFAQVGASLPPSEDGKPFKIKAAKLRGVDSNGMLCGASEIGLEDAVDGLLELPEDAPLGKDIRSYLNLDDNIIEIDLTPNRGDCLSLLGVAREVGVLTNQDVAVPAIEKIAASHDESVAVNIQATDKCGAYAGRVISNINNKAETPLWMREQLRRAGLRSIDPVVDVTNYVLIELGQPMHAFDKAKLNGDIAVRQATNKESLVLLDGQEVIVDEQYLVIADDKQALALAGIIGGESSAVSSETKDIVLEAAFFVPEKIAGKARELGLHTDSSHRFERGVDAKNQVRAIERATQLLLEIVGGEAGPVVHVTESSHTDEPKTLVLRQSQIKRVLGFDMPDEQVAEIFARLDFDPESVNDGWQVTVPSHRFDIALEADLLEELARIYGYENLPVEPPVGDMVFNLKPEARRDLDVIKRHMVSRGYLEAITYSFIDPALHEKFFAEQTAVELMNPISSDMAVMRTSLLPGLVGAVQHNLSRQQKRIKLFETGQSFIASDKKVSHVKTLAGVACGERVAESWLSKREAVKLAGKKADEIDFYDVKGDVESLLKVSGDTSLNQIVFQPLTSVGDALEDNSSGVFSRLGHLHPGQTTLVKSGEDVIGYCGLIHPKLAKQLKLGADVWVFELLLDALCDRQVPVFSEVSRYPAVRRDFAFLIDSKHALGDVLASARSLAGEYLADAVIFDFYADESLGEGKQSVALAVTWQSTQETLADDQISTFSATVIEGLSKQYQVELR